MRSARDLKYHLESIDHRGYPAYKELRGSYDFGDYVLSIDHVQGDPFASPSKASVFVPMDRAAFPPEFHDAPHRRVALEDYLVRCLSKAFAKCSFKASGSGKSGLLATSRPGPEVLERTACEVAPDGVIARFEVGFPANGRTINAPELARILFDYVPACVHEVLLYHSRPAREVRAVAELADDRHYIREQLEARDLVCFIADGSVLPRESGVSSRPMRDALPFVSPQSLRVVLDLPHRGPTPGMGLPRGVTLIVGGGYHGKSTLLKAIEAGVYDHVAGDGRELAITDATAVKLRAEDGRSVRGVDVSLFIDGLPNHADTRCFGTDDASGSTSQAAALVEALETGCRTLLIDEDTSATNFMVRDALMQSVVARAHEPITPFIERVRDLYQRSGVSTVLVAGSSGAFFFVADTVLQMDEYRTLDITPAVREVCASRPAERIVPALGYRLPSDERFLGLGVSGHGPEDPGSSHGSSHGSSRGDARGRGRRGRGGAGDDRRLKVKTFGRDALSVGDTQADLRFVEQLADPEQTEALAQMVRFCIERDLVDGCTVRQMAEAVLDEVARAGLPAIGQDSYASCGMAMPRLQEICACLNRLRVR